MIENSQLLKAAAGQIDVLDAEIKNLNQHKADVFANIRDTVAPEIFKAWRDAVKLRQKRSAGDGARELLDAHDERVWAILNMLEAETDQDDDETATAPVSAPANDDKTETASHVRAHEEEHDPVTGELPEIPEHLDRRGKVAA